eukprot:363818-Chlamydomonas_euryale.AAC.2
MGAYAGATADASAMIGGLAIPTRPVRALVYNGPGAGMRSVLTARQALQEALAPCSEVRMRGGGAVRAGRGMPHGIACVYGGHAARLPPWLRGWLPACMRVSSAARRARRCLYASLR